MIAVQPHSWTSTWRRRLVGLVSAALLVLVAVLGPSSAYAAAYTVWACADGGGRMLPRGDWTEVRDGPQHFLRSTCGDPAAMPATHLLAVAVTAPGNTATDSGAGWSVQAPAATRITSLDVWWAGGTPSYIGKPARIEVLAPTSLFRVDGPNGEIGAFFGTTARPENAGAAFTDSNHWRFEHLSTSTTTLRAWCLSDCQGVREVDGDVQVRNVAYFEAYRLRTAVEDATPPRGRVAGLVDGARISGPTRVQADATDMGGGVREISLRVDGQVVDRVGSEGDCADIDATNGDPYEYNRMQPCPTARSANLSLTPRELADGARHVVTVVATDAAGQETTILSARAAVAAPSGYFSSSRFFNPDLDVLVPRGLNGANAGAARIRLSLVRRHGRRMRFVSRLVVGTRVKPRISGRLTSALGAPISGARVWVASTVASGAWQISGAPLTTSRTGRVSGRLPAHSPSRDVRLVYFPYSDSSEHVLSPTRRLAVRASTTIHLDQARYRNGDTVHFWGRITTVPVSRRKDVYLQVVVRGRWRTFDTTRADPAGGWRLRYRFTATARPTAYRFRAVIPTDEGYPWAMGYSRAVRVLVTP